MGSRYKWVILLGIIFLLSGCTANIGEDTVVTRDSSSESWLTIFSQGDLSSLINKELSYIEEYEDNPWLSSEVLHLVTGYDIIGLLAEHGEDIEFKREPGVVYFSTVDVITEEQRNLINSYKDYAFYSYEEVEHNTLKLRDDVIQPLGYISSLSKSYTNKNTNVVIADWDESLHYLFGVACGFKLREEWSNALQDTVQYGDIVIRAFSAEEIAEFLPANMTWEEQSAYVYKKLHFDTGMKVSKELFNLYNYVYSCCNYKFVTIEDSAISGENQDFNVDETDDSIQEVTNFDYWIENNYSFVITHINKDTREVVIKFVRESYEY